MPFHSTNEIEAFTFESFERAQVRHGIFTRRGGVSPEPWSSLNLGGTVGDARDNVIENRRRIFEYLGKPVESLFDVWQVHSTEIICTTSPRSLDQPHQKADAILTNSTEITLFMRFADCVPILFYDPVKRVAGIAHAGWKGTVEKIAAKTVVEMQKTFASVPKDILVGIGPSIGPHHYQVGDEVIGQVRQAFGSQSSQLLATIHGAVHLDLWAANAMQLEGVGVKSIEVSSICTACDLERWFSHRGEHGKTGRFGALIAL